MSDNIVRPVRVLSNGTPSELILVEIRDLLSNDYYDDIDLTYDGNDNLTEAKYYKNSQLLKTITLTYDGNNNCTNVTIV